MPVKGSPGIAYHPAILFRRTDDPDCDTLSVFGIPPEVRLREGEMDITLAFRTVPDTRIVGGRQTIPSLRALKREPAGDPRFIIPVFSAL
jgi:hypothetical protein